MKKVNFITTLSPQKQYELRRWFVVTIFLSVCALMVAGYFLVPKFLKYRSLQKDIAFLRQQTKNYATAVGAQESLKKEYDTVRVREAKMNSYKQQKKNPYQHVADIVQGCCQGIHLESVRWNKKDVEITVACPTAEQAQIFITQLSASPHFSRMKMMSLQQDAQTKLVRAVVKGNAVF